MSITIELAGRQATFADGKWRSADDVVQDLLNSHLATLNLPAHQPVSDLEGAAADAAVREYAAKILNFNLPPADPARDVDDNLIVY